MVSKEPSAATDSTNEQLRSIFLLLARVQKSLRLYQAESPVAAKLEAELHQRFSELLDESGELVLSVSNWQISSGEEPIYENRDRKDSLAFLFFRDGIRSLTFLPGLELRELRSFLDCLNRVGLLVGGEDDLVTLFWEQDFHHIRYFAVDELSEERDGPGVEQQLAVGIADLAQGGAAPVGPPQGPAQGADGASLDDLNRPQALPVEATRLSEAELDALREEIAAEDSRDPLSTCVELALELIELDSEEAREEIAVALVAVLERCLAGGEPLEMARAYERLRVLADTTFGDSPGARWLLARVTQSLADGPRLSLFLKLLDRGSQLQTEEQRLLSYLAPQGLETLFRSLPRLQSAATRRAVSEAAVGSGDRCLAVLARCLEETGSAASPELVVECLLIVRELPAPGSVAVLERLLATTSGALRREVVLALGQHLRFAGVERVWLGLLDDEDAQVRRWAITAVSRGDGVDLAKRVLEKLLDHEAPKRDFEEMRLAFAAVSKLGSDEAIEWLQPVVQPPRRRWILSRSKRELVQAAAHGIAALETRAAKEALEELVRTGDRFCRAACRQELERVGKGSRRSAR